MTNTFLLHFLHFLVLNISSKYHIQTLGSSEIFQFCPTKCLYLHSLHNNKFNILNNGIKFRLSEQQVKRILEEVVASKKT